MARLLLKQLLPKPARGRLAHEAYLNNACRGDGHSLSRRHSQASGDYLKKRVGVSEKRALKYMATAKQRPSSTQVPQEPP